MSRIENSIISLEESAMLVLTRKMNESITIAGGIEVVIVAVHGNRVRLGFRAPADVAIQRTERVTGEDDRLHPCLENLKPAAMNSR